MNSINNSSERIASATYEWLKAEVANSAEDRNKYLNDFENMRERITLGYENDDNWSAEKNRNHIQRLPILFKGFTEGVETPKADETSARLLLGPLMFLSGDYRLQSFIQAINAESYLYRRGLVTDTGLLENAIYSRLSQTLPTNGNFAQARLSIEGLRRRMEIAAYIGETAMKGVHARLHDGLDMGLQRSVSVHKLKDSQYSWAGFATDVVTIAAKLREGDLESVPFPEPKSITDQERTIPLSELLA